MKIAVIFVAIILASKFLHIYSSAICCYMCYIKIYLLLYLLNYTVSTHIIFIFCGYILIQLLNDTVIRESRRFQLNK